MLANRTRVIRSEAVATDRRLHPWLGTFGQGLTMGIGIVFVVMGAVALVRSGIRSDLVLTAPHVTVGWLHHTPLLAILHLGIGAGVLSAGAYAWLGERPSSFGLLALIVGIILFIEPNALHGSLATHRAHALTYLAVGGLLLASGWMTSLATGRMRFR